MKRSLRGTVAVVGVGETMYYKAGQSPDAEFKLALKAIIAACDDAGIDPKDVDGFASYSNDRSDPSRLAAALGCRELRFANMQCDTHYGGSGRPITSLSGPVVDQAALRSILIQLWDLNLTVRSVRCITVGS